MMKWGKTIGIVKAFQHEPLHFMRRAGSAGVDAEKDWNRLHTEETIRNLAKNNCNFLRIHFFKGSGYQMETEERLLIKDVSQWCRKYDVKLQLYIQFGTISYDSYAAEEPDVLDWVQKDRFGDPIRLTYGSQLYRYLPCFNSPGYWDYLEKIVEDGIVNYHPDAIGFDNITTTDEPETCHCEHCRKAFVAYLKEKYADPKLVTERFGHAILDHMLPPYWNFYNEPQQSNNPSNLNSIRNPSIQEWVWFRNDCVRRTVERMYKVCKKFDPDILVEINAHKYSGCNVAFHHGLYLPDLVNGMDMFVDECDPQPFYMDGVLHHKIHSFKMARAHDKLCSFPAVARGFVRGGVSIRRAHLGFAESMAFHYGCLGGIENALPIADGLCPHGEYKAFEMTHKNLYQAVPRHRFAIYQSKHSYSLSNFDYHYANTLMTQALLRGKLPYSMIFDLNHLANYPAVILADCVCLSADEMDKLAAYVKNGGSLVMTGRTGECDLWNRAWGPDGSLRARLGLGEPEDGVYSGFLRYSAGKGKVLDIPRFEGEKTLKDYAFVKDTTMQVPLDCWIAPNNMGTCLDALRWVTPSELTVTGPEALICELAEDDQNVYLHLINYDCERALSGIGIKLKGRYKAVTQLYPLTNAERSLAMADGTVKVDMDDVYTILCFAKQDSSFRIIS